MNDGQKFLEELSGLPAETYEHFFAECAERLGLGTVFDRNELRLLYEASFSAVSCNLALNAGCDASATSDERVRSRLEYEFMSALDLLYASPGWQALAETKRRRIEQDFLRVQVRNDRLAW